MLTGLSAFPLTPLREDAVDEAAFAGLVERLAASGVDSITALGSTGSYAYLSVDERSRVARLAVEHAGGVPVFVGIGALRTSDVLRNADSAAAAGAQALLLAPMTYQPLTDDDVFELYRAVTEHTELPVIVYDNPGTTHVTFGIDLYQRITELDGIASIKIPGVPADPQMARAHVAAIHDAVPARVTIGVSGDAFGAAGLNAGCAAWYSVIAGTLPAVPLAITRAAGRGDAAGAVALSNGLAPLWELFAECGGSLRVTAAIAEHLGLVGERCLPLPIQGLNTAQRARVADVIARLAPESLSMIQADPNMTRRPIEEIDTCADELADDFENYDPKPGDEDAPLPPVMAVKLAAWRGGTAADGFADVPPAYR